MNDSETMIPSEGPTEFATTIGLLASRSFPLVGSLGEKAPNAWAGLWLGLEALYNFSTCEMSCPGPKTDHTIRILVGRTTNEALGATQGAERGFYDLALNVIRSLWEKYGILALILADSEAFNVYSSGSREEQRVTFAPRRVRERLRSLEHTGSQILDRHYRIATERSIHPYRDELEWAHNPDGLVIGPTWQQGGFVLAINELGAAVGLTLTEVARKESGRADTEMELVRRALNEIADGLGALHLDNLPEWLRHLPK